jgi:hypothetical protein
MGRNKAADRACEDHHEPDGNDHRRDHDREFIDHADRSDD